MNIKINKEISPKATSQLLEKEEKKWRVSLPQDYKEFLLTYNGGTPEKGEFYLSGHTYMIVSFLCVLESTENSDVGHYDIDVVLSQIEDRLTNNEDLVGCELLPIAELFAGDYVCLDFRNNIENPSICIWSHEESEELEPVTYLVADSFSELLDKLR